MKYILKAPPAVKAKHLHPMWIVLHGGHGTADQSIDLFGSAAAMEGAFLLAPQATHSCNPGYYWSFARDANAICDLLTQVCTTHPIDPRQLMIVGYSMGCTMGLWLIASNPGRFVFFAALGMGSAFERWELDDGGIDEASLQKSAQTTRILLAVDQGDPGPAAHFEDNLKRLILVGFTVDICRPNEKTHAVTEPMIAAVRKSMDSVMPVCKKD